MAPLGTKLFCSIVPGGISGAGGMCRFASYLSAEWPQQPDVAPLLVLDSYGPGPLLLMPFHAGAALLRLLWALRRDRVAVLHVNAAERLSIYRKSLFIRLGLLHGVPVILHLHAAEFDRWFLAQSARRREWVRRLFTAVDRVVVLGPASAAFLATRVGVPAAQIVTVSNGVPGPGQRAPWPAPKCPTIVFLGALTYRKGIDVLLRALAQLGQEPPWRCVLAGPGDRREAAAMIAQLGLEASVSLAGAVRHQEAMSLLDAADLLVLPSRAEGMPLVLLEAMARGLPVVASDVGEIARVVLDGTTGLLVRPGDVTGLAEAIGSLVSNPARRRAFGDAGRRRFSARFSLAEQTAKLAALYADVVAERAAGRKMAVTRGRTRPRNARVPSPD